MRCPYVYEDDTRGDRRCVLVMGHRRGHLVELLPGERATPADVRRMLDEVYDAEIARNEANQL